MAENLLRENQSIEDVDRTKLEHPQSDSAESGEALRAREPPPEQALVEALRGFIRSVSPGKEESASSESLQPLQVITLVLLSADLALIYSQVNGWVQNPLFQEALKVLPWMLGATAVGYANKVRRLLVAQARHLKWAIVAAACLIPLLAFQMSVFSLKVDTGSAAVNPNNDQVAPPQGRDGHFLIVFPRLDQYRITVEANTAEGRSNSVPFSLNLTRGRILLGTLAQIPLVGGIFGPEEMSLSPLYTISTHSAGKAEVEVKVDGQFQEGFLDRHFLATKKCEEVHPTKRGQKAVQCLVRGDGGFGLPHGTYEFTLIRSGCYKDLPPTKVPEQTVGQEIDFEKQCPNQEKPD